MVTNPATPPRKISSRVSIPAVTVRREGEGRERPARGRPARAGPGSDETRRSVMKVIVLVKADKNSEAGVMPNEKLLREMGNFNEQLSKAGLMLAGEGLHPTSKGKRVRFDGSTRAVIDGPFAETKELVAGFWIWQVKSMDEAVEWLKKAPFDGGTEVEIRPVFEAEDFGEALTPELRAQEERIRAESESRR